MSYIVLVTGGSRSGKSDYARRRAEALAGPRAFIATCTPLDEEMAERIRRHRLARDPDQWQTVEEPLRPADVLANSDEFKVVLIDCLTLWINNLMFQAEIEGTAIVEDDVTRACEGLLNACDRFDGTVIMVTNEIGMGIVPDNPMSRLYRDLVGRCNQIMAAAADEVVLLVSGVSLNIKGKGS
ncbi:MAG: bifunctional adenosylcobinamide kinase/adenosylcobinamide-phosphate guanylyltransferase [Deltaproteobacteria bacterium]